jgi:hypothetical protein
MTPMLPTDARRLRSELAADDRAWRLGYEAGRRDRWWRRVPEVAWIAAAFAALLASVPVSRRHGAWWERVGVRAGRRILSELAALPPLPLQGRLPLVSERPGYPSPSLQVEEGAR